MLCAATTWLNRAYGAVLGFAWPVTILIGVLTLIRPGNIVALFIHDVAWVLSRDQSPQLRFGSRSPDSDGHLGLQRPPTSDRVLRS